MDTVIEVECTGCGVKGGDNVLTLDETTKWECGCGKINRYETGVREIHVTDSATATQSEG